MTARPLSALRRTWTAVGRLCAALILMALVAGVPIALGTVESPLPAHWSWSQFVTDVRVGYVPSAAVVKIALMAGWMAWVFITYEVVAETASWARRNTSRHSSALGPLQPVLAKLVAAVVLSAPLPGRSIGMSGASPAISATFALAAEAVPFAQPPMAAPTSLPTYVVQPHDTLWGIAERYLGDPLRWSEIATLNEDRQEGAASFGDPHWIYPGWVLVLPGDAVGLAAYSQGSPASADLGQPAQEVAPASTNGATQAPGAVSVTSEPSRAAYAPMARQVPDATERNVPRISRGPDDPSVVSGRQLGRASGTIRPSSVSQRAPVTAIGYGILGAGALLLLDKMRRARQRRQPRGVRIRLPDGELADLERGLRAAADVEMTLSVDLGLRLLGQLVKDGACSAPKLVAVRCRRDALELVFAGPMNQVPPAPFARTPEPSVWRLERNCLMELERMQKHALASSEAPVPTLVTLGADDLGTVLVDVEQLGSLVVVGSEASMVLQGMVVELSTVPWADGADIVVVGGSELRGLERARSAPSVASALAEIRSQSVIHKRLLSQADVSTGAEGRWRAGGPAWDPVVVVCLPDAVRAEADAARCLTESAGEGDSGIVVLIGSDEPSVAARWLAKAEDGVITLHGPAMPESHDDSGAPLAEEFASQQVPLDLLERTDGLFGEEELNQGVMVTRGVPGATVDAMSNNVRARPASSEADADDAEVEIRVLGPVEVFGNAKPFTRAWALDLVVYLAMHRSATTEKWTTALWPDELKAPATIHSTASAARRSLGLSASGAVDHLPRAHGRLTLGHGVRTDWDRFKRLSDVDTPQSRDAALRLLRGRPFEGLRSEWPLLEGHVAEIECVVVDLALRHAESALGGSTTEPSVAEFAARQGLRVSAYDERLYRILLRAADAAGNPAGVEATMQELVQLVAEDVEPFDSVHPETLELYRRLSRRSAVRRGA